MLASFLVVLPILTPPLCALAFIMCSKETIVFDETNISCSRHTLSYTKAPPFFREWETWAEAHVSASVWADESGRTV
jgi:hypothetical protein